MNTQNKKVIAELTGKEFLQLLEKSNIRNKISESVTVKIVSTEKVLKDVDIKAAMAEENLKSMSYADTDENKEVDMLEEVTYLLRDFGIPFHLKGFNYIRSSILLAIENPEVLESIVKILYPTIAKQYNTTPTRVERGIRHAIERACTGGNLEKITEVFKYSISSKKGKPTNAEFLAGLTHYLNLKLVTGGNLDSNTDVNAHMLKEVSDLLHSFGVSYSIKGYQYIRYAILLAIEDPKILGSIFKVMYPTIAKQYNTTPSRVERGIRHAIESAWDKGYSEKINEVFGYSINSDKGKPTNAEFIAGLTDYLRLNCNI